MIATKKYIHDLREKSFIDVSEETEKHIHEQLGKEPKPDDNGSVYEYTEQDLWEQVRKMVRNQ